MTTGLSAYLASELLNAIRGTSFTPPTGLYVKLHTGDPGAAGTANASAVTTRNQGTFAASTSGGPITLSSLSAYTMTAAETISDISVWDAATGGNFLWSTALTTAKTVASGDQLQFNSAPLALTPIAA